MVKSFIQLYSFDSWMDQLQSKGLNHFTIGTKTMKIFMLVYHRESFPTVCFTIHTTKLLCRLSVIRITQ